MKSKNLSNFILILMLVAGLCLLLYPSFANFWNSLHSSKAIGNYDEVIQNLEEEDFTALWNSANEFNGLLNERNDVFRLTDVMRKRYEKELVVENNSVLTYVSIPRIDVSLPVYHGTDEAVLQVAVGHLEWSSLPVGGESTHCVLSGHRGLPSAKLFSELDEMEVGDTFTLRTLGETLTYEVDQIMVVEPEEMWPLQVVEGMDFCTLVTCTPYGVNSHRLFVRGYRVDNAAVVEERRVIADALQTDPMIVAGALLMPCVLIGVISIFVIDGISGAVRKRKYKKQ